MNNFDFHENLKSLSSAVYGGNEKNIPKNYKLIYQKKDKKNGFFGQVFNGPEGIVVAFRGTEPTTAQDLFSDAEMAVLKKQPGQTSSARALYDEMKRAFPNKKITLTGHSLGGSLAALVSAQTGAPAVTFAPYGVGHLLPKGDYNQITNYGDTRDRIFKHNYQNHVGNTFVTGDPFPTCSVFKCGVKKFHKLENLPPLDTAVAAPMHKNSTNMSVLPNVEEYLADPQRVFTREEIATMPQETFSKLYPKIFEAAKKGNVMSENQARAMSLGGDLIWVDSYHRSDGTEVKGYYRRRPSSL